MWMGLIDGHVRLEAHRIDATRGQIDAQQAVERGAHRATGERWAAVRIDARHPHDLVGPTLIGIADAWQIAWRSHNGFLECLPGWLMSNVQRVRPPFSSCCGR